MLTRLPAPSTVLLIVGALLLCCRPAQADNERIVVRDVQLIDCDCVDQNTRVNVLVCQGRLTLVSKDPIPARGGMPGGPFEALGLGEQGLQRKGGLVRVLAEGRYNPLSSGTDLL